MSTYQVEVTITLYNKNDQGISLDQLDDALVMYSCDDNLEIEKVDYDSIQVLDPPRSG